MLPEWSDQRAAASQMRRMSTVPSEDAAIKKEAERIQRVTGCEISRALSITAMVWRAAQRWAFQHPEVASGCEPIDGN